jgi:hypothetical protein
MLLTNETFVSLQVRLSSTDYKQMSCIVNMRLWLLIHSIVTLLIQFFFLNIYFILLFVCLFLFLLSPSFRSFVRVIKENIRLRSYEQEERYLYGIVLLIKEMVLIFVYTLLAFSYK